MQNSIHLYLLISGTVFGIVALMHLARAISNWTFVIGPITVPLVGSWVGFFGAGALCVWAISLAVG